MKIYLEVLKNLISRPATKKYPKEKTLPPESYRGRLTFDRKKCTACGLCRMVCPTKAIRLGIRMKEIKVGKLTFKKAIHPIISIDMGRCVFCGLCVEICPAKAIKFTREYELAEKDRKKLLVK